MNGSRLTALHQAEKGETYVSPGETMSNLHHYFEASKPVCMVAMQVCMVAMHYHLPFMISKCLLQHRCQHQRTKKRDRADEKA